MARKKKTDSVKDGHGLLEIRLGACLTGPTRRLVADLDHLAYQCRVVRNAAIRWWQRWREDHQDYVQDGKKLLPNEVFNTEFRPAMRALAPDVASKIVDKCLNEVQDQLTAKMPYTHTGKARYRWQAILTHEVNAQTFFCHEIPLHNQTIRLCCNGIMATPATGKVGKPVYECGKSSAVFAFQAFSDCSGRSVSNPIMRIETRQLTPGNRLVVQRVAAGQWKLRDSLIVYKEGRGKGRARQKAKHNGAWFLQLCYHQPRQSLGLDPKRVAILRQAPEEAGCPFEIFVESCPQQRWQIGVDRRGKGIAATVRDEARRLEERRGHMRNRYRYAGSGRRGHGRQRNEGPHKAMSRKIQALSVNLARGLVSDVLRFCERFDTGTLLYQEPGLGLRKVSWFARNGVDFSYTPFETTLANKCDLHAIALTVKRVSVKEAM